MSLQTEILRNETRAAPARSDVIHDLRAIPSSTYRLQFHKQFTFRQAAALLPYIRSLGIGACYSSPLLMAQPGSMHGYDICDHTHLNSEIGTSEEFDAFLDQLKSLGMNHILDFVPNHMGLEPGANPWWKDVLENGPWSRYAHFFDIDWDPLKPELKGKVLLPVLGDQYGVVLEKGELKLGFEDGQFSIAYYEHRFPVSPRQYPEILRNGLEKLREQMPAEDPELVELLSVITEFRNLPYKLADVTPGRVEERQRETRIAKDRLSKLVERSARVRDYIAEQLAAFQGEPGRPESFDRLHHLLEAQSYRLSYWKAASHEINYRRFFDINQLAGVRVEEPKVFDLTHQLIARWIQEEKIDGLRLDHPDGLYDPAGYFDNLRRLVSRLKPENSDFYIVVEKILSGEPLPRGWPVEGTSGYDFLNDLNRVFIDERGAGRMLDVYKRCTGQLHPFEEVVYRSKQLIMGTTMASELNVLANALNRISEWNRRSRDFTLHSLRDALREVVACFPVYRTYITEGHVEEFDRAIIERTIARAQRRNPAMESSIFSFVRDVLIPPRPEDLDEAERRRRFEFCMKFQQYTGPVQAKGLEDTAFYRYNLLLSLNDVGGDPRRFGSSIEEFHEANTRRLQQWPYTMLATSTHDTKRAEDARARLNVLSEIPRQWGRAVGHWMRSNAGNRGFADNEVQPDANDEYHFYQALLGAWPATWRQLPEPEFIERLRAYMNKAVKEAKVHSSWISPNAQYEQAMDGFVQKTLSGVGARRFLSSFIPMAGLVARYGMINSLAQTLLKIASPGVPDFYQGTELWDLDLVDPDNRRPVDHALRQKYFEEIKPWLEDATPARAKYVSNLLEHWEDGRIKMFVMAAALRCRQEDPELFLRGDYIPLSAAGERLENVVAFARVKGDRAVVAIVPRKVTQLTGGEPPLGKVWKDTRLSWPGKAPGRWRDMLTNQIIASTGKELQLDQVLAQFPLALLVPEEL